METEAVTDQKPLRIAIIGGGIAGAALAVGLSAVHARGSVHVRLYEQTSSLQELGFAVAFAKSARRALTLLDPRVAATLGLPREDDPAANLGSMIFVDGNNTDRDPQALGPNNSPLGQWASRRTAILENLLSLLAKDIVCPNKKLTQLEGANGDKPNILHFARGETAEADVVIGCDGLHSQIRTHILASNDNATEHTPRFAHTVVHRALVNLDDKNLEALGGTGAGLPPGLLYYIGPGALVIHAPVAPRLMSFSIYMRHSAAWADTRHTKDISTRKADLVDYFATWHPRVRAMADMLPDDHDQKPINTWALFDLAESPLPTFVRDTVAVAGDAAHATMPFYGHGAGMCVLDALCLARLLASAAEANNEGSIGKTEAIKGALHVYDSLLRPHTQFVVDSSRALAERGPMGAREARLPFNTASGKKMSAEFGSRMAIMAGFNVDDMLEQADERFMRIVTRSGNEE
ncbi:hypothetical protein Q7P37_000788 [Cladosporium fusiforme]